MAPNEARPLVGTERAQCGYSETDTAIVGDDTTRRKRFETLRAELALRGFQLLELSDGTFFICRWDRSFHADCLRGVAAFLTRIGGHA
jgi:hypothetical protein